MRNGHGVFPPWTSLGTSWTGWWICPKICHIPVIPRPVPHPVIPRLVIHIIHLLLIMSILVMLPVIPRLSHSLLFKDFHAPFYPKSRHTSCYSKTRSAQSYPKTCPTTCYSRTCSAPRQSKTCTTPSYPQICPTPFHSKTSSVPYAQEYHWYLRNSDVVCVVSSSQDTSHSVDWRSFTTGRERDTVSQTNITTVSKATPGKILRDLVERIWDFPSA